MKILLFKPFEKYRENKLLIVGVICTVIGLYISFLLGFRFDGILDIHLAKSTIEQTIIDNAINISCLVLLLFIAGKFIYSKTRFIDILITVLISRIPIYILTLSNIGGFLKKLLKKLSFDKKTNIFETMGSIEMIVFAIFSIFIILASIWYIALLYNGYKVSSNAKGIKSTIVFIVTIIIAEFLSKLLIYII